MKLKVIKILLVALAALAIFGAGACKGHVEKNDQGETTSVGVKTDPEATEAVKEAGHDVADAAREAGQDMKEGAAKAGDAVAESAEKAGDAIEKGAEKTAQATGDAAITAKVKSMLLADPEVGGLKIEVDTVDGKVTLTGSAETKYQKKEAGKLAMHTEGVRDVNNLITIVPKS